MPVNEVEKLDAYCGKNTIKPRLNHLYTRLRMTVLPRFFHQVACVNLASVCRAQEARGQSLARASIHLASIRVVPPGIGRRH